MDTPLPPISSPLSYFNAHFGSYGVTTHMLGGLLLAIILVVWGLFTLVAIYHWVRYSHAALIAIPSIFVHLLVSGILIVFALSGWSAAAV